MSDTTAPQTGDTVGEQYAATMAAADRLYKPLTDRIKAALDGRLDAAVTLTQTGGMCLGIDVEIISGSHLNGSLLITATDGPLPWYPHEAARINNMMDDVTVSINYLPGIDGKGPDGRWLSSNCDQKHLGDVIVGFARLDGPSIRGEL